MDLHLIIMLNVISRRVVIVARGVMYDIRHPRQEEARSRC